MPNHHEHIQCLTRTLETGVVSERREQILAGQPVILLTPHDEPWSLTTEEVEELLHHYEPDLSATVFGPRIVVFFDTGEDDEENTP